jgi:hypothetical protein
MALGSLRYVTSHDTKPHLFCYRLTRKATIHRKYFVCGSNYPTLRKLSFMKLKYLTCFILTSLIASCGGGKSAAGIDQTGLHSFFVSCGPNAPSQLVSEVGKNFNDAVLRFRLKQPENWYCKSKGYSKYSEGTKNQYLSTFFDEQIQRSEQIDSARQEEEDKRIAAAKERQLAERMRRRLAIEAACQGYGFNTADAQFAGCVKDVSLSIAAMEQKENLEGKMRSTIRSEGALTRSNQEQIAEENRRSARWNARLLATTQTQNTDRLIQNNNMNSN